MKTVNFGIATEYLVKNEIKYSLIVFEREKYVFNSKELLIDYIKSRLTELNKFGEFSSLSLRYERIDNKNHYFLFKDLEKDNEPIVFEETEFEYMRANRHQFKRFARRRIIDDRNYSFADILRSAVNWNPLYSYFSMFMTFLLIVASAIRVGFGLEYVLDVNRDPFIKNALVHQMLLFLLFASSIFFTLFLTIRICNTKKEFSTAVGDYKDIDWKMWYKKRIINLFASIIFGTLIMLATSIYLWVPGNIEEGKIFIYATYVNVGIWGIFVIYQLFLLIIIKISLVKNFKKYYSDLKIKQLINWIKNKVKDEEQRTDEQSFIFPSSNSEQQAREHILLSREIVEKMDKKELQDFKLKIKNEQKRLINEYYEWKNNQGD